MGAEERDTESYMRDMTGSLVSCLRKGDARAGALLDQLFRDALVRFCWGYLGRVDEAEDAVQDIFYRVLMAEDVPDAFRPWLYKITRNHCLNLLRRSARRRDGGQLPAASQVCEVLTGNLTKLVQSEQRSRLGELVQIFDV